MNIQQMIIDEAKRIVETKYNNDFTFLSPFVPSRFDFPVVLSEGGGEVYYIKTFVWYYRKRKIFVLEYKMRKWYQFWKDRTITFTHPVKDNWNIMPENLSQ